MLFSAVAWLACAVAILTAAIRSRKDERALLLGRRATSVLYIAAGAGMNAWFVLRGDDYSTFADGAYLTFVHTTWRDVVVPNHHAWIALLIAFELTVGVLVLLGGRRTQLAYVLAVAFHVALLSFGWGFFIWSVPMVAAFSTLLHGERRSSMLRPSSSGVPRARAAVADR